MEWVVETAGLKPNCSYRLHSASFSFSKITQSNTLENILLRVIALNFSELQITCLLALGMGIIVPTIIDSGDILCTSISLKTIVKNTDSE